MRLRLATIVALLPMLACGTSGNTTSSAVAAAPGGTTAALARRTAPLEPFCAGVRKLLEQRATHCTAAEQDTAPDGRQFEKSCLAGAGRMLVDADVAPRCLTEVERNGAWWEGFVAHLDTCKRVYVGLVPAGGGCEGNDECAGETLCLHGKCTPPQAAGAECVVSTDERTGCVTGFACHNEKEEADTCRKLVSRPRSS